MGGIAATGDRGGSVPMTAASLSTNGLWSIRNAKVIMTVAEIAADREAWKRLRATGVTASDARVLMGHGYRNESLYKAWLAKVDPDSIQPDKPSRAFQDEWMSLGNAIEPVIQQYAEQHLKVSMRNVGMVQSRTDPVLLANPDRLVSDGRAAEFKMTGSGSLQKPDVTGVCTSEVGSVMPIGWFDQVQFQMLVGGWEQVVVCALVVDQYSREFHYWEIDSNLEYQATLRERALWFWGTVLDGVPPAATPKDEVDELTLRWPEAEGDRKVSETQAARIRRLVQDRATFLAEQKILKESLDYVENQLRILAGDHSRIVDPKGKPIYSWSSRTKRSANTEHLAEVIPEISYLSSATKETKYRQLGGFAKAGKEAK
jgi:predicted phage-related endonuclease